MIMPSPASLGMTKVWVTQCGEESEVAESGGDIVLPSGEVLFLGEV